LVLIVVLCVGSGLGQRLRVKDDDVSFFKQGEEESGLGGTGATERSSNQVGKRRSLGQLKIDRSMKAKAVQQAIYKEAARYNIDPNFVIAIVWQESRFRPDAVSEKNARGLMPLMPETAGKVQCSRSSRSTRVDPRGCGVSRVVAGQV
jgi:hypothetical protein